MGAEQQQQQQQNHGFSSSSKHPAELPQQLLQLPCLIADAISSMQWPLDRPSAAQSMQLLPLHELETPVLPSWGELHALELVHVILSQTTTTTTTTTDSNNNTATTNESTRDENTIRNEQWAQIAAATILLGHGYADHAHNLIGPLSYQNDLPYFYGPAVIADVDILAAASLLHALVHRKEGPHPSEFGTTGYTNSNFWASAALRSGGEETLPLAWIRHRVEQLALSYNDTDTTTTTMSSSMHGLAGAAGGTAHQWFQSNYGGSSGGGKQQQSRTVVEEWDPRPLTTLCEEVLVTATQHFEQQQHQPSKQQQQHPLLEFAQEAALVELQVLVDLALTQLGYGRIHQESASTRTQSSSILASSSSLSTSSLGGVGRGGMRLLASSNRALPQTLEEASSPAFGNDAVVVTTATHPHQIVYVNPAWVELCGYTPEHAVGKTFSQLLHGQESNTAVARKAALQCHDTRLPHQVYVVNYTASGERFVNHVTMGPILYQEGSGGVGSTNTKKRRRRHHTATTTATMMMVDDEHAASDDSDDNNNDHHGSGSAAAAAEEAAVDHRRSSPEYMVAILERVEQDSGTAIAA